MSLGSQHLGPRNMGYLIQEGLSNRKKNSPTVVTQLNCELNEFSETKMDEANILSSSMCQKTRYCKRGRIKSNKARLLISITV